MSVRRRPSIMEGVGREGKQGGREADGALAGAGWTPSATKMWRLTRGSNLQPRISEFCVTISAPAERTQDYKYFTLCDVQISVKKKKKKKKKRDWKFFWARRGARTHDPEIKSLVLYRLS